MPTPPPFVEFAKIPRLSRDCIVTEKLDGTNGAILITEDGDMFAASRSRWITPADDNYGFARWVDGNRSELRKLGPGLHHGEWWGQGIQRNYSLREKRFSLFNTTKWAEESARPPCCYCVPVLAVAPFDTPALALKQLKRLSDEGSVAAPGFMKPEGVVIFHVAARLFFKKTITRDEEPKSAAK